MFPLQLAFILRHYCPVVKLWLLLLSLHSAMDRLYCYMDHMSVLLFIGVGRIIARVSVIRLPSESKKKNFVRAFLAAAEFFSHSVHVPPVR